MHTLTSVCIFYHVGVYMCAFMCVTSPYTLQQFYSMNASTSVCALLRTYVYGAMPCMYVRMCGMKCICLHAAVQCVVVPLDLHTSYSSSHVLIASIATHQHIELYSSLDATRYYVMITNGSCFVNTTTCLPLCVCVYGPLLAFSGGLSL